MERFPKKVLLATDGPEDAALAARAAADVSKGTGSELHVVHVLPRFPRHAHAGITPEFYSYVLDKAHGEACRLLDEQAKRIEDGGGRVAETHVRRGQFIDEILDLAEELGAGLMVMGRRGLGPIKRLALGSVSEGVVNHARCPVLVMRGGQGAWPPERIVIGDDGSQTAKVAGEMAVSIGKLAGAKALLVRAYPKLPEVDVEGREMNARMIDDELRREEMALEGRAADLESALGMRPRIMIAAGDAATVLLEAAGEEGVERALIAVGSRGLGKMRRLRLGSVSAKVLRATKGPLLISPPPTAEDRR